MYWQDEIEWRLEQDRRLQRAVVADAIAGVKLDLQRLAAAMGTTYDDAAESLMRVLERAPTPPTA